MEFKYCPNCRVKLMGRVSVGTGSGILCESCFYGKQSTDRLAELREKYDPDKDVGIYRNTALRYARDAGCTVLWDETTLIEDRAVIVELLDMLEAKDKGIRPKITAVRYLELRKKYGPGSNIATVETEDGRGDYISANWADEAVYDVNKLLDAVEL